MMGDNQSHPEEHSLNKEQFVEIVKNFLEVRHHPWNDTVEAEIEKWFDHINTNNDSAITTKEIFKHIFSWFDHNGDGQISNKEMHNMWVGYAKSMGRTLNEGWWNNTVHPAIKHIEAGISPDELQEFLSKHNKKITDFRQAVISLSTPIGGSTDNHGNDGQHDNNDGNHDNNDGNHDGSHDNGPNPAPPHGK